MKYTDPDGLISWDTVQKGGSNLYNGISKMGLGIGILGATGAGEVLSGGTASPLAIAGAIVGGGVTAIGFTQSVTGVSEIIAGLTTDESDKDLTAVVPNTLTETLAVPVDAGIELASGEKSTKAKDIAQTIDKKLDIPSNNVAGLLVENPTPLNERSPSDLNKNMQLKKQPKE